MHVWPVPASEWLLPVASRTPTSRPKDAPPQFLPTRLADELRSVPGAPPPTFDPDSGRPLLQPFRK